MQYLFDDNLAVSFQKVVEKSLIEFFKEHDLTSFQKMLRDGMNSICAEIQKRLLERIDDHFVSNADHRKNWVIERRNDAKTILSPFGQITYRRTYFKNKKTGQYEMCIRDRQDEDYPTYRHKYGDLLGTAQTFLEKTPGENHDKYRS